LLIGIIGVKKDNRHLNLTAVINCPLAAFLKAVLTLSVKKSKIITSIHYNN